jgi:hypothetical protein
VQTGRTRSEVLCEVLAGSWRPDPSSASVSTAELEGIAPLLHGSGSAGLAWQRVRGSAMADLPVAEGYAGGPKAMGQSTLPGARGAGSHYAFSVEASGFVETPLAEPDQCDAVDWCTIQRSTTGSVSARLLCAPRAEIFGQASS